MNKVKIIHIRCLPNIPNWFSWAQSSFPPLFLVLCVALPEIWFLQLDPVNLCHFCCTSFYLKSNQIASLLISFGIPRALVSTNDINIEPTLYLPCLPGKRVNPLSLWSEIVRCIFPIFIFSTSDCRHGESVIKIREDTQSPCLTTFFFPVRNCQTTLET